MDGKGEPILIHGADWSSVSAAAPARIGEILILFPTGLGDVSPPIEAGLPANGRLYHAPAGAVTVTFAGLAPGFVGLNQINFQVPADSADGTVAAVAQRFSVSWFASATAVDPYEITAIDGIQSTEVTARSNTVPVILAGLKSATPYAITVRATISCANG